MPRDRFRGVRCGPGASCPFDEFTQIVRRGMEVYGDFNRVCGNDEEEDFGGGGV